MEPHVLWDDCITSNQPWIPSHRLPRWSANRTIYFRARNVTDNQCTGVIVDLQLPNLGQNPQNRSYLSTMEAITVHCSKRQIFRSGYTYVLWGTLCPVWHPEDGTWHVQLPALTPSTGVASVLADRQIDMHVSAFEICAGGMGGWSAALQCFPQWHVSVAVDNDEEMLANFALNHDFRFMRMQDFLQEPNCDGPIALLADIMESDWLLATLHMTLRFGWCLFHVRVGPPWDMGLGQTVTVDVYCSGLYSVPGLCSRFTYLWKTFRAFASIRNIQGSVRPWKRLVSFWQQVWSMIWPGSRTSPGVDGLPCSSTLLGLKSGRAWGDSCPHCVMMRRCSIRRGTVSRC